MQELTEQNKMNCTFYIFKDDNYRIHFKMCFNICIMYGCHVKLQTYK